MENAPEIALSVIASHSQVKIEGMGVNILAHALLPRAIHTESKNRPRKTNKDTCYFKSWYAHALSHLLPKYHSLSISDKTVSH